MILSYVRTVVLYLVLIASVRLMGKRQIGQMEASEFVVTMLVANLASIPMQDEGVPLYSGLVPILTVLGAELVLSGLSLRSVLLRRALCGKPIILVENGQPVQENMQKTRITLDELTGMLRQNQVLDIRTVQYAILETGGNLSVFPYPAELPASAKAAGIRAGKQYLPVALISDGYLSRENLKLCGRSEGWLRTVLAQHHATVEDTFLLTLDGAGRTHWVGKQVGI